jgi:acyl-CoA thioesterase YciA
VAGHEVEFHQPVFVGDVLSLYADAVKCGKSSLTIHVRVCARRRNDPDQAIKVTEAEVVFVAVDENGTPVPIFA